MPNKEQERIYAKKAIEFLGLDWQLNDIPEPLDFEVVDGISAWGLEVRNIYKCETRDKGSRDKEHESRTSRLLFNLAREYYTAGGSPIRVKVRGTSSLHSKRTEVLSNLLARRLGALWSQEVLNASSDSGLYVTDLPADLGKYSRWQVIDQYVGWTRPVSQEEIQKAINEKAAKLPAYQAKYQRIDLLLVEDRIFGSGRLLPLANVQISNPGFANVYFLSYPDAIQEL